MNAGHDRILGKQFGTVIYGAGKGIWKTFADYVNGAESYFLGDNELFYLGDLDYEGILIYEHLLEQKEYQWDRQGNGSAEMTNFSGKHTRRCWIRRFRLVFQLFLT